MNERKQRRQKSEERRMRPRRRSGETAVGGDAENT